MVPWTIPAIGLSLADIGGRIHRRRILAAASLTLFIPLQVMFGYWRGSLSFEGFDETVYWAHLVGGLSGLYLVVGTMGLFVLAGTWQLPHQFGKWGNARVLTASVLIMVSTFVVQVWGVSQHFWMLGDQIRGWSIALGPFTSLPLVGPATHVGGYTIGPAFYWILWPIRVVVGPWFQNFPHAGGIGQAALQSGVDALFLVAVWKRTGSVWLGLAAVVLLATAPFDLALSAVIWNPVVGSILAKAAMALILLDWQRGSLARVGITAAIAWSAVHAYTGTIFVALGIFAALIVNEAVRHDWRAVWRRGLVIVAVVAALQVPYATHQLDLPGAFRTT